MSAVTLLPGATITAADLTEAVASMPVGLGPDIVHVVPELSSERDVPSHRQRACARPGFPKPGRAGMVFRTAQQASFAS